MDKSTFRGRLYWVILIILLCIVSIILFHCLRVGNEQRLKGIARAVEDLRADELERKRAFT